MKSRTFTLTISGNFFIFLITLLLLNSFTLKSQTVNDSLSGTVNGVWWVQNNALEDVSAFARMSPDELATLGTTPAQIKSSYPPTVGVLVTVTWSSLRPDNQLPYNWDALDSVLQTYLNSNLLVTLMLWVGPDAPSWIYGNGFNVPEVTTADGTIYPYYLYTKTNGKQPYKDAWYQLMTDVSNHIKAYSTAMRKNIKVIQSAEGSTGDEGPYNTDPVGPDTIYKIRRLPEWRDFKRSAWKKQDTLYRVTISNYSRQIHLMVNCDPRRPRRFGLAL